MCDKRAEDFYKELDGYFYWAGTGQDGVGQRWSAAIYFRTKDADGGFADCRVLLPDTYESESEARGAVDDYARVLIESQAIRAVCPAAYREQR